MIGALYTGTTGIKANTKALSVVGDNIANVNTTAFKSNRPEFANLLSQSLAGYTGNEIGNGVTMTGQSTDWTQGIPETTGSPTDLAIAGKGFFIVSDSNQDFYTRAGNFSFDKDGNLVNPEHLNVQGYGIKEGVQSNTIENITIPPGNISPATTTEMSLNVNLDADASYGTLLDKASLVIGEGFAAEDSNITFTAIEGGVEGNDISIVYSEPNAANNPLNISVAGDVIVVELAKEAGVITSTASEIATAINNDEDAKLLVAAVAQGEGIVEAQAKSYLLGGGGIVLTAANADIVSAAAKASLSDSVAQKIIDLSGDCSEVIVNCVNALSDVTYTAVDGGTAGNNITIAYVDPSANDSPLSVSAIGNDITVSLATNATGVITSTAAEVAAVVNSNVDASALVYAVEEDNIGNGIVTAMVAANLVGGEDKDITFTAVDRGSGGEITIEYADPSAINSPLSIDVTSNAITVNLATDANGTFTSTAAEVATAINAAASSLVTASANGAGAGVVGVVPPTHVEVEVGDSNVVYTAVNGGIEGNNISITYVDPGTINSPLTIDATGNIIIVKLATDASGAIVSTAAHIASAVNNDATASTLVSATAQGNGNGIVTEQPFVNLSGGAPEGAIAYTAVEKGSNGNATSIAYSNPNIANSVLSVDVEGDAITVNLATDAYGNVISTAAEVAAAVNANSNASELVTAVVEGDMSSTIGTADATCLSGGIETAAIEPDSYSTTVTVYDSLGNAIDLTTEYTFVGEQTWEWITNTSDGICHECMSGGILQFDEHGNRVLPIDNPNIKITNLTSGAEDLEINWKIGDNFTAYAAPSNISFITQDGYASGSLKDVSINDDGFVSGVYSNGQIIPLYQVAMADFTTYTGLGRMGNNIYTETIASGQPLVGVPGSGSLGNINTQTLEMSNVDLATEMVNLITTQRAFQANSKVITTSAEVINDLINLKR